MSEDLREKAVAIDIDEVELADDTVQLNPDADPFALPPPASDGDHVAKVELFKGNVPTGIEKGRNKRGEEYLRVHLVATIEDDKDDFFNHKVFYRPTTQVMQSSGSSEIAGVLKALQLPVYAQDSKVEMVRRLKNVLVDGARCGITTQWQASVKLADGTYEVVVRGMKKFPPKKAADGSIVPGEYVPILDHPKYGELTAQAVITRLFPLK